MRDEPERGVRSQSGAMNRGEPAGIRSSALPGGRSKHRTADWLAEANGNQAEWKLVRALTRAACELLHDLPNLDFGLPALERTYGLPDYGSLGLFALDRTAGWFANAME